MDGLPLARAPNLRGVLHGFTTRAGGVSQGPLATLNLSMRPHESAAALAENWARVARALHPSLVQVAVMNQVHGGDVVRVSAGGGPLEPVADADGMYTTEPGLVLGVRVADCVPVLLAGPGVIGVAHAGWRGAVAQVAASTARAMVEAAGIRPDQISAAVGPCISAEAFEVGPEVVDGLGAAFVRGTSLAGRPLMDLAAAVAHQLRAAGVEDVWIDGRCTTREAELWSHRRDGPDAGRFAGVIARLP